MTADGSRAVYTGGPLRPMAPEDGLAVLARLVPSSRNAYKPGNAWPEQPAFGPLVELVCGHCHESLGLQPTAAVAGELGPSVPCPYCGRNSHHPPADEVPERKTGRKK